ncbi:LysR family transcriptional regulator [Paraburkholderia sp. J76]|uniref:LysR family transcriptional regulator n=1 Tax=Paraburkholderia sp. J76 TaxID=2805439 RepID=UPI002ABE76B4|nr:LysR family transcriptional regulator [Paraburkholderia sp. J76]
MHSLTSQQDRETGSTLQGIDLVELETFIAVAETGSFSAAAQRLHVAQPSVTGRVQRLETALGTKLLLRTTRKVETTPDGALLLEQATEALRGLRRIVGQFRSNARLARHRVVVAATPMLAAHTLPALIQRYAARFPDVQVELCDLQYADALAALDGGTADLAVLALEGNDPRYRFEKLWTREMALVVPPGHELAGLERVDLEVLARFPLMVVEQYQPIVGRIREALAQRGLTLPPVRAVANLNTLLGMFDAGMGVTLLPRSSLTRFGSNERAGIEIEGVDLQRHFGIAVARHSEPNTSTLSFWQFLRENVSSD